MTARRLVGPALAGALVCAALASAPAAWARHDPWLVETGDPNDSHCGFCHTLDTNNGAPSAESGTSYINPSARTMLPMKAANGGTVPATFGCTFCHSDKLTNVRMQDALSSFLNRTNRHPVGRDFSGTVTDKLYLTTIGTDMTNELDCVDCHDAALLTYPDHQTVANGGTWNQTTNPSALLNVTAATDKNKNFCVNTCHGGAVPGGNNAYKPKMGHYGWGGYTDTGGTLKEPSGTAIKVANTVCATCHDSHFSTVNDARLANDGKDFYGSSDGSTAVDPANCTGICHEGGASGSDFQTKGHGMANNREGTAPIGHDPVACTPCHNASVAHRDGSTASTRRRLAGYPYDADLSDNVQNLASDGLDNDMDGYIDAADTALVGNLVPESQFKHSRESICRTCHSSYREHSGDVATRGGGQFYVGCLDCHDPHGKGVGSNVEMVRQSIAGETTVYASADGPYDFMRAGDANGVCDNQACHGANQATILAVQAHVDNGVVAGANCVACHSHTSATYSFSAACGSCHDNPPDTGAHLVHVNGSVQNGYGYTCNQCHNGNNHNPGNLVTTPATFYAQYTRSLVDLGFSFNTDANNGNLGAPTATKGSTYSLTTCSNLACHNPDNQVTGKVLAGNQTNNIPVWGTTIGTCTACHGPNTSGDPAGSSHQAHDATYGYACTYCHNDVNVTTAAPGRATHADLVFNGDQVVFGGTLGGQTISGTYATGTGVCSNIYCHGEFTNGNTANNPDWDGGTGGGCGDCHGASALTPPASGAHDKHVDKNAYGCQTCHWAATHDGTTVLPAGHANGTLNVDDDNVAPALDSFAYAGAGSCDSVTCHGGASGVSWTGGPFACEDCHTRTGGSKTASDIPDFHRDGSVMSKIDDVASTGQYDTLGHGAKAKACTDCHSSAVEHDTTADLTGSNPFRLGMSYNTPDTFCSNTASGCHNGAASSVVMTHSNEVMTMDQRTWPAWDPKCVDCHDPHGDGANLAMIQTDLFDRGSTTHGVPTTPKTTDTTVFTVRGQIEAGSYAESSTGNGICQECHLANDGGATGMLSFLDGNTTPLAGNHPTSGLSPCTSCHIHKGGFEPAACEVCHDSTPYVKGSATAPNVMGNGVLFGGDTGHTTPKAYDDGSFGYNVNGHGRDGDTSGISHGNAIDVGCTSCHDISQPVGTHLDGVLNGRLSPDTRNANSFHLNSSFVSGSLTSEWDAQVKFDNNCYNQCHVGKTSPGNPNDPAPYNTQGMRHGVLDSLPALNARQFVPPVSRNAPSNTPPPIIFYDKHLRDLGGYDNPPHGLLCVSCHDPHGTNVTSPWADGNNRMVIYRWANPATLCAKCH